MNVRIISCNKTRQSFLLEGEAEYLKRLKPWTKLELLELEVSSKLPEAELKKKEASKVLECINPGEFLIALDERGKDLGSEEFARFLEGKMQAGCSKFCFAIGGAFGWDDSVRRKSGLTLALSKMTFPHQMARLILIEQIYRAFSIIKGQPYHKR